MAVECINEKFSTTRKLTKARSNYLRFLSDVSYGSVLDSSRERKHNEGGLRTLGLFKSQDIEPIVTVITVALNAGRGLEETILSVLNQTYSNIEYIVIDGGSTDEALEVLNKYEHAIDYWVSEPDRGIYDAMNKGIKASTGDWLNFLNAKDKFCNTNTIQAISSKYLYGNAKFIYSDVLLASSNPKDLELTRYTCNHEKLIVNHQAAIYHKSLHLDYGLYLVAPGLTISDYLFFSLIDRSKYLKVDDPIAIYDTTGVTQSKRASDQKFVVDYLTNGLPKYKFLFYLNFYFFYKTVKRKIANLLKSCKAR